jgi:hypothetical protein
MGLQYDFAKDAEKLLEVLDPFLEEWFGPRCSDFKKDCLCCQMWKTRDDLVENPFDEDDE